MSNLEFRITVRCAREPEKHAKVIRIVHGAGRQYVDTFAALLDGSSEFYVHKPGPNSPIGKCAICGGQIECHVEEVEACRHIRNNTVMFKAITEKTGMEYQCGICRVKMSPQEYQQWLTDTLADQRKRLGRTLEIVKKKDDANS